MEFYFLLYVLLIRMTLSWMTRPLKGNCLVIQPLLHISSFKINKASEGKDLGYTEGTQHSVLTENKIPSSKKNPGWKGLQCAVTSCLHPCPQV